MNFDSLGDRIKFYEKNAMPERFLPMIPVVVRLDGVSFHNYTRGYKRPYDERLSKSMQETMIALVRQTNAIIGYTQSDEITLVLYTSGPKIQIYFDGKVQKIISVLASKCSVIFDSHLVNELDNTAFGELYSPCPNFDCRAFSVPSKWEACNALIWREQDAVRNSIQMAARSVYSHKECDKKSCAELQEMLHQKGINWNDYPDFFKRGTFYLKRYEELTYSESIVSGRIYYTQDVPTLTKIVNLPEFIFDNQIPVLKETV